MSNNDQTAYDGGTTLPDDMTELRNVELTDDGAATEDCATAPEKDAVAPQEDVIIEKGAMLLDTYQVESDAIQGGMGKVWRVRHTGWNVNLAMKQPKSELFQNERQKADFIHECEAWINLGLHPQIVSCYYVREMGGVPSIFSEWMDGGSLKDWIASGKLYEGGARAALERVLDIAIQFGRGLHYAHEQGLIHQDVKPDNLLLTTEGEAKVADFGIAKARAVLTVSNADTPADATIMSNSGAYTPAYCSMEQLNGKVLTRRTDIYSWAVSVLEMFLGERLWQSGIAAGAACEDYFAMEMRVSMPESMKNLLRQCFDENPEKRPHDFGEIDVALVGIYQEAVGDAYPREVSKAAADTADSLNNRALSFLDMGKTVEAEKCWERALMIDPDQVDCVFNYAMHLWRTAKIDDVEAINRMRNFPENSRAYCLKALLHMERGDFGTAKDQLDQITKADKTDMAEKLHNIIYNDVTPYFPSHTLSYSEPKDGESFCTTFHLNGKSIWRGFADGSIEVEDNYFFDIVENEKDYTAWERGIDYYWDEDDSDLDDEDDSDLDDEDERNIRMRLKGHKKAVWSICFSHDQRYLFSRSSDGIGIIWNAMTGELIRKFRVRKAEHEINACFSADGQAVHMITHGEIIETFDLKGRRRMKKVLPKGSYYKATFSPDRRYAVLYGMGGCDLYEFDSFQKVRSYAGHTNAVIDVCFSKNGEMLLTGSNDRTVKLWDVQSGRCLKTFVGHNSGICCLCFIDNDTKAYSISQEERRSNSRTDKIWDLETGHCVTAIFLEQIPLFIMEVPGKLAIAEKYSWTNNSSAAKFRAISRPEYRAEVSLSHIVATEQKQSEQDSFRKNFSAAKACYEQKDIGGALEHLNEAAQISAFGELEQIRELRDKISVYCETKSILSLGLLRKLPVKTSDYVAFCGTSDSLFIADAFLHRAGRKEGFAPQLWDARSGDTIRRFDTQLRIVSGRCLSPDGRYLLASQYQHENEAYLVETASGKYLQKFRMGNVKSLDFSVDSNYFLCATPYAAHLCEANSGNLIRTFLTPKGHIEKACFDLSGTSIQMRVSCGSRQVMRIAWRVEEKKFAEHAAEVEDKFYYSPDGNYTAKFKSDNRQLTIYNAAGSSVETNLGPVTGYSSISSIVFGHDGKYLLISCENKVYFYETVSANLAKTLVCGGKINSIALNDKGSLLAVSLKESVEIWECIYDYTFPGWADWDERATFYLQRYLKITPNWRQGDLDRLFLELGYKSLGFLKEEGVMAKLDELAADSMLLSETYARASMQHEGGQNRDSNFKRLDK